jgi:hypothetical protein
MKIALHDAALEPYVDFENGLPQIFHASIDFDIDGYLEKNTDLSESQKATLIKLWSDEEIERDYVRTDFGVLISERTSPGPSIAPRP